MKGPSFEDLFDKRLGMIKPGLDRVKKAFAMLGSPVKSEQIPTLLIGGTNGKGSTAGKLWQYLSLNGLKCGLYTSPHLRSFVERFQVSGESVSENDVITVWNQVKSMLDAKTYDDLSFFEVATLIALKLFSERNCQIVLLEVGLGGRLDATNLIEPIASVIVSVSRDHEAYLGSELATILEEKWGISRPGRPLFWGAGGECMSDHAAMQRFRHLLKQDHAPIVFEMDKHFGEREQRFFFRSPSDEEPEDIEFADLPEKDRREASFLKRNALLALAVYTYLQRNLPHLNLLKTERLVEKLAIVAPPRPFSLAGRFQRLSVLFESVRRDILFDVCHNLDGVHQHKQNLWEQNLGGCPAFVSILKDKSVNEMLDVLRESHRKVLLFQLESDRSFSRADLKTRHQDLLLFESFAKAWQFALSSWHNQKEPWAICGSVMAVGNCLEYFDIDVSAT